MEPEDNKQYLNKQYWDDRYEVEENYEWLVSYTQIKPELDPLLTTESSILVLGCGNSSLSLDLFTGGYVDITSIDISDILIDKLTEKHRDKPLKWVHMDMLDLKFLPSTFDVAIDKATMDVLQTDNEDPWDPNPCLLYTSDAADE